MFYIVNVSVKFVKSIDMYEKLFMYKRDNLKFNTKSVERILNEIKKKAFVKTVIVLLHWWAFQY